MNSGDSFFTLRSFGHSDSRGRPADEPRKHNRYCRKHGKRDYHPASLPLRNLRTGLGSHRSLVFPLHPPNQSSDHHCDPAVLSSLARLKDVEAPIDATPDRQSARLQDIPKETALRIAGVSSGYSHVCLPYNGHGYVRPPDRETVRIGRKGKENS